MVPLSLCGCVGALPILRGGWSVRKHGAVLVNAFPFSFLVSNQVGSPAELKHIIKRRKRN